MKKEARKKEQNRVERGAWEEKGKKRWNFRPVLEQHIKTKSRQKRTSSPSLFSLHHFLSFVFISFLFFLIIYFSSCVCFVVRVFKWGLWNNIYHKKLPEQTQNMDFKIKMCMCSTHFSSWFSCSADLFLNCLFLQYVPPDLCICNFVLEQSLSVRALQEMLASTGENAGEGVSKLM